MANGNYTVQLVDLVTRRIVLDNVVSDSAADAATLAAAAPPVSGENSGAGIYTAEQVISQAQILTVTGTDASGDPSVAATALPIVPDLTSQPLV